MAKIIIFNNDTDRMETYYRDESQECHTITIEL